MERHPTDRGLSNARLFTLLFIFLGVPGVLVMVVFTPTGLIVPSPSATASGPAAAAVQEAPTAMPTPPDTPTASPTPVPQPSTTAPLDDATREKVFLATLTQQGVDVRTSTQEGSTFYLGYYGSATEAEIAMEIGAISGSYAAVVEDGWPITRLVVVVYRVDGSAAGAFYIEREWGLAYMDGRLSGEEYFELVVSTLEVDE